MAMTLLDPALVAALEDAASLTPKGPMLVTLQALDAIAPITKTAAAWTADATTVLAIGQRGLESDTRNFKFGNGSDVWANLDYAGGEQPPSVDVSPVAVEYKVRDSSAPQVILDPGDRRITANGTVGVNQTVIAPTEATEVRLDDTAVRGSTYRVTVTNSDYPVDLHRTSHTLRLAPAGSKITVAGTAVSGFDTTNIAAGQAIQVFKEGLELGIDESTETAVELLPLLADGTTIDSIGTVGVNGSVTLSVAADEDSVAAVFAEVIVGERGEINGQTLPVRLWEGAHDIEVISAAPFLHLAVVGPGPDLQTPEALTDDFALTPARWGSTLLFTAAVAKTATIPAGVPGAWAVIDNRGTDDLAINGTAASVVIDTKQGDGKTYDPTIPAGGKAVLTYYAALDAKLDGRLKETV